MISHCYKRLIARIALPIITIWMCFIPSRSYALAPVVPIAIAAVDSAAVATTIDAGATAVVTLIGAAISYFSLQDAAGNKVRVPTTSDPAKAPPKPSAPATSLPQQHLDPNATYTVLDNGPSTGRGCPTGSGLSFQQACEATTCVGGWTIVSNFGGSYRASIISIIDNVCKFTDGYQTHVFTGQTSLQCNPGYTLSGSVCVLSNPNLVTPDKATDIQRVGNAFSVTPDIDNATNPIKGSINPTTGVYEFSGSDTSGKPLQVVITPASTGGSTVQINKQGADVAGNTLTTTVNLTINSQGIVEGASQSQTNNALQVDPATQTATLTPTGNVAQNPTASTPVTFPSDYARTGEAAAAANTINAKLDTLHNDLTGTTNSADPVEPTSTDMPGWGNTFSNLLGWTLPAHTSACPTPSLDLSSVGLGVHTMDQHCTLINDHFNSLNTAMIVVWTILAVFIVLRA